MNSFKFQISNFKFISKRNAFTLIELLIAIALSTIIASTIIYVLKAGLDSWEYGQGQALCQISAETAVDSIVEGDYFYDGLREALEITKAQEKEIHFIPWYVQNVERIEPGKKFELEKPLLQGSAFPVGEVYDEKKKEFEFINLQYFLDSKSGTPKEYARFEVMKAYKTGRIIYYPDVNKKTEAIMQIAYDPGKKMIYRTYLGKSKPLFKGEKNIIDLSFRYFDSSNNVLHEENISAINDSHYKKTLTTPITAVEAIVTCESGSETYMLKTFVNIRKKGIAGSGVYLTEKARIKIPDSKNVKILALTNFGGITGVSKVELMINNEKDISTPYLLRINFDNINGVEYLTSYSIEYPKGETVLSKDLNRPAYLGLSFLALDPSGHYDYDDDEAIEDFVIFEGDDVELTVETMEIGGMNLFVR